MRYILVGCHINAFLLLLTLPLAAQEVPSSWVRRHSTLERTITRLSEATSSSERIAEIERLAHLGPPERVASGLAAALAVELEPQVRQALITASVRVAALDASAASVLGPIAIQRFGEGRSAEDRAPWARLLGLLATAEAIDALMPHGAEEAVQDALVDARATDALLARLGTESERALVVPLLGRIGDPRAVEPLFGLLGAGAAGDVSTLEALSRIASAGEEPVSIARVRAAIEVALLVNEDAHRLVRLFDALAGTGSLEGASRPVAIEAHLTDAEPVVREAALRCAHALDPAWAAAFAAALSPDDPRLSALLPVSDEPALVPLAVALAALESGDHDLALDFLVRARDGAGIDALIALDAPPLIVAVASRRWSTGLPSASSPAHLALAGHAPMFPVASEDDDTRLLGAIALALSAEPPPGPLAAWVQREPDRAVRAWLLEAVRRHHVALDARFVGRLLLDEDPEPAAILVVPWAEGTSRDRRALRRALSRLLRTGTPAQVAAAVWSLSMMGARDASAAIEALLDDHHPAVRIAAGGALRILRPERSRYLRARAAIDPDPRAARLLEGPAPAVGAFDVLFLDVTTSGVEVSAPWIEVQTDDGLLRQLPVAPDGTFALIDVPGDVAEVRLLLQEAPRVRR